MLKIMSAAAVLLGVLSSGAAAQTVIVVPSDQPVEVVPWYSAAPARKNAPVLPGTSSVPSPYYQTPTEKQLDTPSAGGGG